MQPLSLESSIWLTDASNSILGAILVQQWEGVECPVAFASCKLNSAEVRYISQEDPGEEMLQAHKRQHQLAKEDQQNVKTSQDSLRGEVCGCWGCSQGLEALRTDPNTSEGRPRDPYATGNLPGRETETETGLKLCEPVLHRLFK